MSQLLRLLLDPSYVVEQTFLPETSMMRNMIEHVENMSRRGFTLFNGFLHWCEQTQQLESFFEAFYYLQQVCPYTASLFMRSCFALGNQDLCCYQKDYEWMYQTIPFRMLSEFWAENAESCGAKPSWMEDDALSIAYAADSFAQEFEYHIVQLSRYLLSLVQSTVEKKSRGLPSGKQIAWLSDDNEEIEALLAKPESGVRSYNAEELMRIISKQHLMWKFLEVHGYKRNGLIHQYMSQNLPESLSELDIQSVIRAIKHLDGSAVTNGSQLLIQYRSFGQGVTIAIELTGCWKNRPGETVQSIKDLQMLYIMEWGKENGNLTKKQTSTITNLVNGCFPPKNFSPKVLRKPGVKEFIQDQRRVLLLADNQKANWTEWLRNGSFDVHVEEYKHLMVSYLLSCGLLEKVERLPSRKRFEQTIKTQGKYQAIDNEKLYQILNEIDCHFFTNKSNSLFIQYKFECPPTEGILSLLNQKQASDGYLDKDFRQEGQSIALTAKSMTDKSTSTARTAFVPWDDIVAFILEKIPGRQIVSLFISCKVIKNVIENSDECKAIIMKRLGLYFDAERIEEYGMLCVNSPAWPVVKQLSLSLTNKCTTCSNYGALFECFGSRMCKACFSSLAIENTAIELVYQMHKGEYYSLPHVVCKDIVTLFTSRCLGKRRFFLKSDIEKLSSRYVKNLESELSRVAYVKYEEHLSQGEASGEGCSNEAFLYEDDDSSEGSAGSPCWCCECCCSEGVSSSASFYDSGSFDSDFEILDPSESFNDMGPFEPLAIHDINDVSRCRVVVRNIRESRGPN
eukprot:750391-Hanusia_phi.AAC.1